MIWRLQKNPDFTKFWGQDALPGPLSEAVAQGPTLKLTVFTDGEQVIPVREVGKLSLSDFAKIYSVSQPLLNVLLSSIEPMPSDWLACMRTSCCCAGGGIVYSDIRPQYSQHTQATGMKSCGMQAKPAEIVQSKTFEPAGYILLGHRLKSNLPSSQAQCTVALVSATPCQHFRCDHTLVRMQKYAHGLGKCLMELQQDCNSPGLQQLQTWVTEMESLFVCIVLSCPGRLKEVNNSRMDEGRVCSADRPSDFYSNLLVEPHSSPCFPTAPNCLHVKCKQTCSSCSTALRAPLYIQRFACQVSTDFLFIQLAAMHALALLPLHIHVLDCLQTPGCNLSPH